MRKDLEWFSEFASEWNGTSLIPPPTPNRVLQVDASGSGIGAHDHRHTYGGRITPVHDPVVNITELEAVNVVVAINIFLGKVEAGSHVLVQCDSLGSVEVFHNGRGKNKVLLECARHLWMVQAILNIQISYEHIAGRDNSIADSLSRLHIHDIYKNVAFTFLKKNDIPYVQPDLYIFEAIYPLLVSRAGVQLAPTQGCQEAATSQGSWNHQEPSGERQSIPGILSTA